jgi:hypothetical protein
MKLPPLVFNDLRSTFGVTGNGGIPAAEFTHGGKDAAVPAVVQDH